jgi:hypothetical protein
MLLLLRKDSPTLKRILLITDTSELKGYWVNPLGISPNVKIGPDMALQLGITYAVSDKII